MTSQIQDFKPITLDEMKGIRLMNRTDTKFVTTLSMLSKLLSLATSDYLIQEVNGERLSPYYTVYFDTPHYDMYLMHEKGHANRQKLRIRSYVHSKLNFLEIKTKDNHGRTNKNRIHINDFDAESPNHHITFDEDNSLCSNFLREYLHYDIESLKECLENKFKRITLVNRMKTERLTIDTALSFHNLITDNKVIMDNIAIIELKRDGRLGSPILSILRQLRIKPLGFSKYCIGSALTNSSLPHGRIKPRLHAIEKIETRIY